MGGYIGDVKLDLHGSIQQQGFTSLRHDYAVRRCVVRGLNNDFFDLGLAIRKVFQTTGVGLYHQDLYLLPLTKVRAVKWGPNKAKVQLIYARGRFSPPPIGALNTASTYKAYEYIPVYKMPFTVGPTGLPSGPVYDRADPGAQPPVNTNTGLPAGDWYKLADPNDETKPPIAYRLRRPVVRVVYNTVISFNPFAVTEQYVNKINESVVKMGNVQFNPYTLRFDGINAEASQIWAGSGVSDAASASQTFSVEYEFTANPDGHYRQYAYWDEFDQIWKTANVLGYETSNFRPKDFPSHS